MNIEYMKNLIYTFVGSMALVLLTGCSAEFENGTPEPWQREINPNENYEYTIKHPCLVNTEADFERARRKVNEGAEPWISGWQKLCDSRFAQLNYNSNPQKKLCATQKAETSIRLLLMPVPLISWLYAGKFREMKIMRKRLLKF